MENTEDVSPRLKYPLNPYLQFCTDTRGQMIKELPELSSSEITKVLSQKWKELDVEVKEAYKTNYEQRKNEFFAQNNVEGVKHKNKRLKKKDPSAPKKPLSSFMEFCKEIRSSLKDELCKLPLAEVGRELGRRWRELSQEDKESFEARAKQNREQYANEVQIYQSQNKQDSSLTLETVSET